MDRRWICGFLLLLAGNAIAGQKAVYYVDNRYNFSNAAILPHYRSAEEACVTGVLMRKVRGYQEGGTYRYRFRTVFVGQDDGFGEFDCKGVIEKQPNAGGSWTNVETVQGSANQVHGPLGSVETCTPSGAADPETGQCGPPKSATTTLGDSIDAASGDLHLAETDFTGAGAFPLDFARTYDSDRSWLNNPVPVGIGWTHSYLAHVAIMPSQNSSTLNEAVAYRPDGRILRFNLGGGVWVADADVAERLSVVFDSAGVPFAALSTTDDAVEQYDQLGRLLSITDRNGLVQALGYTTTSGSSTITHNDVQQVVDPQGHALAFAYNGTTGQLASITDSNGTTTQYTYGDANGTLANINLKTVVYPDLNAGTRTRTYSYNESGQTDAAWPDALTGIDEEIADGTTNRHASWSYDSQGKAKSSRHGPFASATIDRTTLAFNANGTTTFVDALGQSRTYGFTVKNRVAHPASLDVACDGCQAHDKTRGYDANGYPNASTDFNGNASNYNLTSAVDSHGHARGLETQRIEGSAGDGSLRTINTSWNPNFRVPDQRSVLDSTNAEKARTNWIYNTRGQTTFRCEIDPAISAATAYACGSSANASVPLGARQASWTYCDAIDAACPLIGLLRTSTDPRGNATTYAYYGSSDQSGCATQGGACHQPGDVQSVTNALSQATTYDSYDKDGRLTRSTDANGVRTDLAYHPRGWLIQRAVRGANDSTATDDHVTTWSYDGAGLLRKVTRPAGDALSYNYDIAHRLTDVIDSLGNSLHYAMDDAGNRTEEDSIGHGGGIARKVLHGYDTLGRLHTVTNAVDGSTAMTNQYDANGNLQTATDGRSHVTIDSYDALNRLKQTEQDATGLDAFTSYAHDALDRLADVMDPQGLHTSYQFDGLGNQTQLSSPDTGIATYGYDVAGNRTGQTDARPVGTISTYDALNRITASMYPTASLDVAYHYDVLEPGTVCPLADQFPVGHLTYFSDASGSTQFCYDRFGDLALKSQAMSSPAFNYNVTYKYNKSDRLIQVILPRQTTIKYTRDAAGRIARVSYRLKDDTVDTQVAQNVGYEPFGPVSTITYDNGSGHPRTLTRDYDTDYVIQKVRDTTNDGLGVFLTYQRDAVGNLTKITDGNTPGLGNKLIYDGLDRLTNVNRLNDNPVWTYGYDLTGNRTSKKAFAGTPVAYTYPLDSHHLIDVGGIARGYDAIGNTQAIGATQTFTYDDMGRMAELDNGATQLKKYAYNARGERVLKSHDGVPAETQRTVYDEAGHVLGDFDRNSNIIDQYIWMDGLPIGVLSGATPTLAYIEPDHIGTPRAVIDAASNASVWMWPLVDDPFGEKPPQATTFTLNLRMPGQVFDAESGLNYNYFRDYDSGTGRYIESDSVGLRGGISTYDYAAVDPIRYYDPYGLSSTGGLPCGGEDGWTVCRGGKITAENCNKKNPCTGSCTGAHEKSHVDYQASHGYTCNGVPDGHPARPTHFDALDYDRDECVAHKAGVDACKTLNNCPPNQCTQQRNDYIREKTGLGQRHCTLATMTW